MKSEKKYKKFTYRITKMRLWLLQIFMFLKLDFISSLNSTYPLTCYILLVWLISCFLEQLDFFLATHESLLKEYSCGVGNRVWRFVSI